MVVELSSRLIVKIESALSINKSDVEEIEKRIKVTKEPRESIFLNSIAKPYIDKCIFFQEEYTASPLSLRHDEIAKLLKAMDDMLRDTFYEPYLLDQFYE